MKCSVLSWYVSVKYGIMCFVIKLVPGCYLDALKAYRTNKTLVEFVLMKYKVC